MGNCLNSTFPAKKCQKAPNFTWISLHKPSPFWRTFSAMTHIVGIMFATAELITVSVESFWFMIHALKKTRGYRGWNPPHCLQVIAMPLSRSVCLLAAPRRYSAIRWVLRRARVATLGGPWKLEAFGVAPKPWWFTNGVNFLTGWWFGRFLEFSPRNLGKCSNLTNIFQRGWNHQVVNSFLIFRKGTPHQISSLIYLEPWAPRLLPIYQVSRAQK